MTGTELIGELMYGSYRFNRRQSPATTPEQWKLVYGEAVEHMEARYQEEPPTNGQPEPAAAEELRSRVEVEQGAL